MILNLILNKAFFLFCFIVNIKFPRKTNIVFELDPELLTNEDIFNILCEAQNDAVTTVEPLGVKVYEDSFVADFGMHAGEREDDDDLDKYSNVRTRFTPEVVIVDDLEVVDHLNSNDRDPFASDEESDEEVENDGDGEPSSKQITNEPTAASDLKILKEYFDFKLPQISVNEGMHDLRK